MPSQNCQLEQLVTELRSIRAQLDGLRDTVAQFVSGASYEAPSFFFSQHGIVEGELVEERLRSLRAEGGSDVAGHLSRLGRYSELFFLEYAEKAEAGDLAQALAALKLAIQCEQTHTPFQRLLFTLYQRKFQTLHRAACEAFRKFCEGAEMVVMHLSCKPRAEKAKKSADTFVDPHSRIRNIMVVGHLLGAKGTYTFLPDSALLIVPAGDEYEHLAAKSAAAYEFFGFAGNAIPVLKVDDDIHCLDPTRLLAEFVPLVRSEEYVGRVWHARYGFSRSWHLGKCRDPELNRMPYGLLNDSSYAEGPAYGLGVRAIQVLANASVYLQRHFEVEGAYEDVAVGKVLNRYGIVPVNYDPIRSQVLGSTDDWMMERAGLPPIAHS